MRKTALYFCHGLILFLVFHSSYAQNREFTRADTLRGTLSALRSSFDVHYYELRVRIFPHEQAIAGNNQIYFTINNPVETIQLDLFSNLQIDSLIFEGRRLDFEREANAFFVRFPRQLQKDSLYSVSVYYQGNPVVAENPPWDGGFIWEEDSSGVDWISVACQGLGASAWWPNKDHPSDEPDSMRIIGEVPDGLTCISNGRFEGSQSAGEGYTAYSWFVSYPINNYNVTINAAGYAHFSDHYAGRQGDTLALDYYVLKYNLEKAKPHFQQVKGMLRCFEDLFGRFPFWNDGYKLVETPYWGMEHQTAIAYGNNYENNEFGFDFIIVHESAHEYWGNSVTAHDLGEMWIHEALGTYTEALYVEYFRGYDSAVAYLERQKALIRNNQAIVQPTGVNFHYWEDADMYYKGSWMMHTIRHIVDDDALWYEIIRGLYQKFKYRIVTSEEIVDYLNDRTKTDLSAVLDQYLNYTRPPELRYRLTSTDNEITLTYKWVAAAKNFNMPLKLGSGDDAVWIRPTGKWKTKRIRNLTKEAFQLPFSAYYFTATEVEE